MARPFKHNSASVKAIVLLSRYQHPAARAFQDGCGDSVSGARIHDFRLRRNRWCLAESWRFFEASRRTTKSDGGRIELRIVEHPLLQELAKALQIDVGQSLVVIAAEH